MDIERTEREAGELWQAGMLLQAFNKFVLIVIIIGLTLFAFMGLTADPLLSIVFAVLGFIPAYLGYLVFKLLNNSARTQANTAAVQVELFKHQKQIETLLKDILASQVHRQAEDSINARLDTVTGAQTTEAQTSNSSSKAIDPIETADEPPSHKKRRQTAESEIARFGQVIRREGDYPNFRWSITDKNGMTQRFSSVEDLVTYSLTVIR